MKNIPSKPVAHLKRTYYVAGFKSKAEQFTGPQIESRSIHRWCGLKGSPLLELKRERRPPCEPRASVEGRARQPRKRRRRSPNASKSRDGGNHVKHFQGLIPHSFQSSAFFSKTCRFPWVSGGFLERRDPWKWKWKVPLEGWVPCSVPREASWFPQTTKSRLKQRHTQTRHGQHSII